MLLSKLRRVTMVIVLIYTTDRISAQERETVKELPHENDCG